MPRGEPVNVLHGVEARVKILEGAKKVYDAVAASYGPISGNSSIQRSYGYANVTHDGVTIAKSIYLKDEGEDMGAGFLVQASEKSNSISGDGTSATVLLGYHIINLANQRIAAGYNRMGLRRGIDKASVYIKEELDKLAIPVKDSDLAKVASISASDSEIGKLVADTVLKVGGVGITIEEYDGLGVIQDVVEGLYFEQGWALPHFVTDRTTEEAVHENVSVLVLEKKIKQNQDIIPILEMAYKDTQHKTVLIIGNIDGQAMETCALTNLNGKVKVCVVRPPVYGDQELPFLEDVASMTGAKLVTSSLPADKVTSDFLGNAKKIIVAKDSTTILEAQGLREDVDLRISNLETQLKSDKYNAFQKERMEKRLAMLKGKIGLIKVGGATESEAKEMKFRVEDAVNATRAAREEGVVAGGAVTLATLLKDSKETWGGLTDELVGYNVVMAALKEPFKQLMENAGQDGGYRLQQILKAKPNFGFDVKEMTDEPIDLIKAQIIDPVKVLKSVVENACSVAGIAITLDTIITTDHEYQLEQVRLNKANM